MWGQGQKVNSSTNEPSLNTPLPCFQPHFSFLYPSETAGLAVATASLDPWVDRHPAPPCRVQGSPTNTLPSSLLIPKIPGLSHWLMPLPQQHSPPCSDLLIYNHYNGVSGSTDINIYACLAILNLSDQEEHFHTNLSLNLCL